MLPLRAWLVAALVGGLCGAVVPDASLALLAPVNISVIPAPALGPSETVVVSDLMAAFEFEVTTTTSGLNTSILLVSSSDSAILSVEAAPLAFTILDENRARVGVNATCLVTGVVRLRAQLVAVFAPTFATAVGSGELNVACVVGIGVCSVSSCSGHGVCASPAPASAAAQCVCDAGYDGLDCAGTLAPRAVRPATGALRALTTAPAAPTVELCARATLELDVVFSGIGATARDRLEVWSMDSATGGSPLALVETFYASGARFTAPSDAGMLAQTARTIRPNVTLVTPGLFAVYRAAAGAARAPLLRVNVSAANQLACVAPVITPCYAPSATPCQGVGSMCSLVTGRCECAAGEFFYGERCERGCSRNTSVVVEFGGEVTNGAAPDDGEPLLNSSVCAVTVLVTRARTREIAVRFVEFSVDPSSPLVLTDSAGTATVLAGDAWGSSLKFNGSSVRFSFGASAARAQGRFRAIVLALGCRPGWYVDLTGAVDAATGARVPACLPCPAGSVSTSFESTTCTPCATGTYAFAPASIVCTRADPGQYVDTVGATSFELCAPGTHSSADGASVCTPCAAGFVAPSAGMAACVRCNSSGYSVVGESTACRACPPNTLSAVDGAESVIWCRCVTGTFSVNGTAGTPCEPCPAGASCAGGTDPPRPYAGYWADALAPTVVYKCVRASSCAGGASNACNNGYTGVLCSICPDGTADSGTSCTACSRAAPLLLAGAVAVGMLVVAFVYQTSNASSNDNLGSTIGLGTAFGLWIQYLQIAVLFREYRVRWPDALQRSLALLSLVNLDAAFLQPSCSLTASYELGLYVRLFLPVFVVLLLALAHAVHRLHRPLVHAIAPWIRREYPNFANLSGHKIALVSKESTARDRALARIQLTLARVLTVHAPMSFRRSVNALVALSEIFFVFLVTTAFEAFGCMDNTYGVSSLVAEPSIRCYSARWFRLLPVVVVAIVFMCIVLPTVYAVAIWWILSTESGQSASHDRAWLLFSSLVYKYKRTHRWWVFAVLARKLVVAFLVTAFPAQPMLQSLSSLAALLIALVVQMQTKPYRLEQHNVIDYLLLLSNVVLLLFGLAFYQNELSSRWHTVAALTALLLLYGSCFCMFVYFSREIWRLVSDKPVNRSATLSELFERRHIPFSNAVRSLFRKLGLPPIAVFRVFSLASDDELRATLAVARVVNVAVSQAKNAGTVERLALWSARYNHTNRAPKLAPAELVTFARSTTDLPTIQLDETGAVTVNASVGSPEPVDTGRGVGGLLSVPNSGRAALAMPALMTAVGRPRRDSFDETVSWLVAAHQYDLHAPAVSSASVTVTEHVPMPMPTSTRRNTDTQSERARGQTADANAAAALKSTTESAPGSATMGAYDEDDERASSNGVELVAVAKSPARAQPRRVSRNAVAPALDDDDNNNNNDDDESNNVASASARPNMQTRGVTKQRSTLLAAKELSPRVIAHGAGARRRSNAEPIAAVPAVPSQAHAIAEKLQAVSARSTTGGRAVLTRSVVDASKGMTKESPTTTSSGDPAFH